jgi:flagella basal body P-ring formation protein FlgA
MKLFRHSQLFAVIISFFILAPGLAIGAQTKKVTLGQDDFEKAFSELVTRNGLPASGDVEIKKFSCDPCQLSVSSGLVDYLIISQSRGNQQGSETITADVLVDGITQGRVTMNGDVHIFGEVVCAAQPLQRHQIIHPDNLITIRRDISMLGPDFINSASLAVGTELKTTLRPGAILYKRFLKKPKLVRRGDVVSIMAQTDQLNIRVPGRIESDGALGDVIRVKNLMSRKEVYARVVNSEEVLVDF